MSYVLAASRPGFESMAKRLSTRLNTRVTLIKEKSRLTPKVLERLKPRAIFFPHWSYIVPEAIHQQYECVIFHMTDLPFGRGGTPLQNLIARGHKKTKMSALRCTRELDAGPIYMKRLLSLNGTAEEIYQRAARLMESMIISLVRRPRIPVPQKGRVVHFSRRKPPESNLSSVSNLQKAYDHIRMLDAAGYPHAYVDMKGLRFEFTQARLMKGGLTAHVTISKK
jgi:methionyl-tRNA formyltransferase